MNSPQDGNKYYKKKKKPRATLHFIIILYIYLYFLVPFLSSSHFKASFFDTYKHLNLLPLKNSFFDLQFIVHIYLYIYNYLFLSVSAFITIRTPLVVFFFF